MKKFKSIIMGSLASVLMIGGISNINNYSDNITKNSEYDLIEDINNEEDIINNINYYNQEIEKYENYKQVALDEIEHLEYFQGDLSNRKNTLLEVLKIWDFEPTVYNYDYFVNWFNSFTTPVGSYDELETVEITASDGVTSFEIEYLFNIMGESNNEDTLEIQSITSSNEIYTNIFQNVQAITFIDNNSDEILDELRIDLDSETETMSTIYLWNLFSNEANIKENFIQTILYVVIFSPNSSNTTTIQNQVKNFDLLLGQYGRLIDLLMSISEKLIFNKNSLIIKIDEKLITLNEQLDFWNNATVDDFEKNNKWVLPLIIVLIVILFILMFITLFWYKSLRKNNSLNGQIQTLLQNTNENN